jgi:hypothetical protein
LKCSLDKFDGSEKEYAGWRFQLRAYLGKFALVKALDAGTLTTGESAQIYYAIATAVTGTAVREVQDVTEGDGAGIWRALETRYDPKRVTARHALLRKLISSPCKGVEEVEDWLAEKITARNKLTAANITLEEVAIIGVLDGLPDALSVTREIALATPNLTLDNLKRSILEKVDALNRAEGADQAAQGLAVGTQQKQKSDRPTCMWCGKLGHYAASCFQNPHNANNKLKDAEGSTGEPKDKKKKFKDKKKKKGGAQANTATVDDLKL